MKINKVPLTNKRKIRTIYRILSNENEQSSTFKQNSNTIAGPAIQQKNWEKRRMKINKVPPSNKRKIRSIYRIL